MTNFNTLKNQNDLSMFQDSGIKYTVSSRNLLNNMDIQEYLELYFPYININQVESFFGFADEFSQFYGGRGVTENNLLSQKNISDFEKYNKNLSLTFTNHYFDIETYNQSFKLLEKYHKKGNSVVCTNDDLAKQIKKDFPLYELKASLIKDLNTLEKVKNALEIYDYVVIPMEMNDYDDFLKSLPSKERIILFGNANCAYNCTSRICYLSISKNLTNRPNSQLSCSKEIVPREQLGHTFFDIQKLKSFGFKHFKLVPSPAIAKKSKKNSVKEEFYLNIISQFKEIFYLVSFPKSGRTWLRFIIANYLNLYFDLKIEVNLKTFFSIIPNDDIGKIKGIAGYKYVKDRRFPLILASHKPLNRINNDNKKIVLLRNIYDVLVSDYFQHVYYLKRFNGTISEFIRQENGSLFRYCEFINSVNKNDKIITYENMHKNIEAEVTKVLNFLGLEIDVAILKNSIELSSFENMKESEKENSIAGRPHKDGKYDENSARVREGKVNNYHKYLTQSDIQYIDEVSEKLLTSKSKEILAFS
jgi:hypothetical protein